MDFAMSTVKYLLFIFNFIFVLCGLAILVVGVLGQVQLSVVSVVVAGKFKVPPNALIVIGLIIFVIAFYGCCGSIRESLCMVVTYAVFLLVILIIEVAIAVVAFVYSDDIGDVCVDHLKYLVHDYTAHTKEVDDIQTTLKCCGVKSVNDYLDFHKAIPKTCCPKDVTECTSIYVYTKGCQKAIENLLSYEGLLLGGIAIGVAVIEVIGILFALCLAISIKNESRCGVYH